MSRHLVFVYGTLKRGQRNAVFMRDAEFLGPHRTETRFWMYQFEDYPAVCEGGRHAIHGELYRVDDGLMQRLDDLEWYPHFYQRIEIATPHGDAWMYVVRRELCRGKKRLPGRWPGSR